MSNPHMQFLISAYVLLYFSTCISLLAPSFLFLALKRDPPFCLSDFHFSPRRSVFPISQLSELTFLSITGRFIPRVLLLYPSVPSMFPLSAPVSLFAFTWLCLSQSPDNISFGLHWFLTLFQCFKLSYLFTRMHGH